MIECPGMAAITSPRWKQLGPREVEIDPVLSEKIPELTTLCVIHQQGTHFIAKIRDQFEAPTADDIIKILSRCSIQTVSSQESMSFADRKDKTHKCALGPIKHTFSPPSEAYYPPQTAPALLQAQTNRSTDSPQAPQPISEPHS